MTEGSIIVRRELPDDVLCFGVRMAGGKTIMVANRDRVTKAELLEQFAEDVQWWTPSMEEIKEFQEEFDRQMATPYQELMERLAEIDADSE